MTHLLPKWLKRLLSKKKLKQLQPLKNQTILIEELHPTVSIVGKLRKVYINQEGNIITELSSVWKGIVDYDYWDLKMLTPRMEWYFFAKIPLLFVVTIRYKKTDKYNTLRRQATVYKRFRKFKSKTTSMISYIQYKKIQ